MKFSIIIVNYKSRVYLEGCLASIFAKIDANISFEVIVVNNDSEDDLTGLLMIFPGIKIIQNKKNIGFGGGNNLGVKIAKGELLLFLNPDAEIISNNISEVWDEFNKNSAVGIIGSKLLTSTGVEQEWSAGGAVNLRGILENKLKKQGSLGKNKKKQELAWVAGTALFIRASLFRELNGFDEKFFMYFEDVDLCQRAKNLGKKVLHFPAFLILHHGGKSYCEKKIQKKQYYQSQDYYFKKHLGFFETCLLKILRFMKYGV